MNCGRNCACQSFKKRNKLALLYNKVGIDQLKIVILKWFFPWGA
jgi:hypothetical protein